MEHLDIEDLHPSCILSKSVTCTVSPLYRTGGRTTGPADACGPLTGIIGDDFSMNICKSWENEFFKSETENLRKVALRTSIVLGNNGGAFPKLKMLTKFGLGGKQGRGNQNVSWIHIEDFCRAVEFIIEHENISGNINITAAHPLSNEEFMKKLRKEMNIPFGLNAPVWQLEIASIILNTETELLLKSRNVYPEKLIKSGFEFSYSTVESAFKNLLLSK
jgi:uncharacterized protein (TIGR01777 family)